MAGFAFGAALLTPSAAMGQQTFTYTATDYQSEVVTGPAPAVIVVRTTVIVLADPNAPARPQEATKSFAIRLRPPTAELPQLQQAFVGGEVVDLNVQRSNLDGELEAVVNVPVTAGNAPEVKVDWVTKNLGTVETTVQLDPQDQIQNLHAWIRPRARQIVIPGRRANVVSSIVSNILFG